MIGIVTHPTSAAVFNAFASLFDLIFAEPGTSVGVVWTPDRPLEAIMHAVSEADLLENGWIDGVVPRPEQHQRLASIIGLVARHSVEIGMPHVSLPTELDRPLVDYLDVVAAPFTEMKGDRVEYDDRGVVTGIGAINGLPVALAVQDSRVSTNTAAAIRKIQRVARFAGRFELPLVMVVDGKQPDLPYTVTPGESFAAAKLTAVMSVVPIPVISVGAGKVQGLVSHLMMTGDRRLMAEHASYRLSGAEGGRAWPPNPVAQDGREWTARECARMGLIDQVIDMPEGGVSADPWMAVRMLQEDVHTALLDLGRLGPRKLVERRARANREMGHTEEGIASVLGELREWQDVQQSISKSIDDWRERLEQRAGGSESRSLRPNFQRPDLSELGARLKARQERLKNELLERTGRYDKIDSGEGEQG
jgi:acetyl-CoA carboxylase alpha subunit